MSVSWVAVSQLGYLYYSIDGITWEPSTGKKLSIIEYLNIREYRHIYFSNDKWVAIGNKDTTASCVLVSDDGINWVDSNLTSNDYQSGHTVYAVGNIWLVTVAYISGTYSIVRSTDGITFLPVNFGDWTSPQEYSMVEYIGSKWLMYGKLTDGVCIKYSSDGNNWSDSTGYTILNVISMAYNQIDNIIIAVGEPSFGTDNVIISDDNGMSWSNLANISSGNTLNRIVYGDGTWVIQPSNDNTYYYSTNNGSTWNSTTLPSTSGTTNNELKYANGVWVTNCVDFLNNSLFYSNNGINWFPVNTNLVLPSSYDIHNNGNRWIAVGTRGGKGGQPDILYSDDGINWFETTFSSRFDLNDPMVSVYGYSLPPCFAIDTPILTSKGEKLVQDIIENDDIISGIKVKALMKRKILPDYKLVTFKKDSISLNIPSKDTTVTENHMININNEVKLAKNWINKETIISINISEPTYIYHILLENNQWRWINVNGILAESLHPNHINEMP